MKEEPSWWIKMHTNECDAKVRKRKKKDWIEWKCEGCGSKYCVVVNGGKNEE